MDYYRSKDGEHMIAITSEGDVVEFELLAATPDDEADAVEQSKTGDDEGVAVEETPDAAPVQEETPTGFQKFEKPTVRRFAPKTCCGSKGPRHLATCPGEAKQDRTTEAVEEPQREMLTEEQYTKVNSLYYDDDMDKQEIVGEMSIGMDQVLNAINCSNYDVYKTKVLVGR